MLDHVLASLLLFGIPARAALREREPSAFEPAVPRRYATTVCVILILLALLALDWRIAGRNIMALGLARPMSTPALTGVAIAALVLVASAGLTWRSAVNGEIDPLDGIAPRTPGETRLYVATAIAAGVGWEVLYRGYLLFYLTPRVGMVAGVILSSIAYAAAHGVRDRRKLVASGGSALAFTPGYALTGNLWWLIVVHVTLPSLPLATARPHTAGHG